MNYIAEMRKHVGHDVVMTVGCGVLIENEKDEVLLQKRSDTGEWCVPGGALEPGETYVEAAIRELNEETGIFVSDLKLFGLYSGSDRKIQYHNGDVVYSLSVIFITTNYSGEISVPDGEALEHRFFDRDTIPKELFVPDARPILDWAKGIKKVEVK